MYLINSNIGKGSGFLSISHHEAYVLGDEVVGENLNGATIECSA